MRKNVDILFSKEVREGRFNIEYKFEKSLKTVKVFSDSDDGRDENPNNALELFVEGLKEKGIKFPITLVSLEEDYDKKAFIMDFITSDDISVRILLKWLSYKLSFACDRIIIERKKGRILITEGFKGYFKLEGNSIERVLSFQSMEMNSEENYPESMSSIIPERVRFQLDDSNFFEVTNYKKRSFAEYLNFVNNTNFKEIKTASQLNRRISKFLETNMEEVLLLRDTNNKHNQYIERFAFKTFDCYLFKSFSGVNDSTNSWRSFEGFLYVETFDDDITLHIFGDKRNLDIYLYQNGDWLISLYMGVYDPNKPHGEPQVRYPDLQNFYDEEQEIIIAKAKKILKENLGSAISKILNSFSKEDIEMNKFFLQNLRELTYPQNDI